MTNEKLCIGCAGWSIPAIARNAFPEEGTHLARYAARFSAVEINSSFYRPHKRATYERWAATTPDAFRFSVKIPKHITHELRLVDTVPALEKFIGEAGGLASKLGCLLVQLPPSLVFDHTIAETFFGDIRTVFAGMIALEPRHATWFSSSANALAVEHRVSRVAADPSLHEGGTQPGGYADAVYFRLHGSPRTYYSSYSDESLQLTADALRSARERSADSWCIFDNTVLGAATQNALALTALLGDESAVTGTVPVA